MAIETFGPEEGSVYQDPGDDFREGGAWDEYRSTADDGGEPVHEKEAVDQSSLDLEGKAADLTPSRQRTTRAIRDALGTKSDPNE